jgi:PhnB protein
MPYLIVNNATKFLTFMQTVFGAVELFKAMADNGGIMHGEVMIGDSTIMFADRPEKSEPQPAGMFIWVDNADEVYNTAIEHGATAVTKLANQSYGRSGGVLDPFGNTWWITSMI